MTPPPLPPNYHQSIPYDPSKQPMADPGPSRWQTNQYPSNPSPPYQHSFHPSSYGPNYPFSAVALGANSSNGSSNLGMSISPPSWIPGNAPWSSGSYVGSLGAMGTSFGRERDRELEAKYVRDFSCCGRQLNGLHELLEHYEEEHANLPPEVRMAAINAAQGAAPTTRPNIPFTSPPMQQPHGDAPAPPGMMDIEMDLPPQSAPSSPWASVFRPQPLSQGVPPSLLSFTQPQSLTTEQLEAKALKKAQRKAERLAREETTTSDAEGDKRFPCPIEGCGKVYKQANGLKYHLTRSINSGHGNVAALGLAALLGDRPEGGG